MPTAVSVPE